MTTTLLVHGVGLWPGCFAPVEAHITGPSRRWVRPGYEDRPPVADLDAQTRALRHEVERSGPTVVIGVSGGATLALALAIDPPPNLRAAVAHEPLIGPLEATLHHRVTQAGQRLAATDTPGQDADAFLVGLYGSSWVDLPAEGRAWAQDHAAVVCREVAHFAAFGPDRAQLARAAPKLTTTVGQRSGPERQRVAELLGRLGARTVSLADCGHLAPLDNPRGLASALES